MSTFEIIALTSASFPELASNPAFASAAMRAGAAAVLDLEYAGAPLEVLPVLDSLTGLGGGVCGIKCGIDQLPSLSGVIGALGGRRTEARNLIILAAGGNGFAKSSLGKAVRDLHESGLRVVVEIISEAEGLMAQKAGADAVIAKGNESAGRVGEETTFVLLQRCRRLLDLAILAQGGIGIHTACACYVAGATGVVLDSQLLLARESPLSPEVKSRISRMDGSETVLVAGRSGESFRYIARTGPKAAEELDLGGEELGDQQLEPGWRARAARRVRESVESARGRERLLVLGQDVCLAHPMAVSFFTVGGIIQAIAGAVGEHVRVAGACRALAEGSAMARSQQTRYPIVQGAMTRVSDTAGFALSVARAGALPFLALALMRGSEIEKLLAETVGCLEGLPWGVGILGFVPPELRQEQLEAVKRYRPPFALIAGGRPDQARSLDEAGIQTYLHVPSPLLLKSFIDMGSRRFIFEGKECGGHVGPRSSFVLWESMIQVLLGSIGSKEDAGRYHILFAGGIHDDLSAAMVEVMAAPLSERGVKVGVLMGTAYLFTEEAVKTGAIVGGFQKAAISCDHTVLIETGPGHSIRCIESPYRQTFDAHRRMLQQNQRSRDEIREELELMNLGRLRIASKGLARSGSEGLQAIPEERQWRDGMYMIGQVSALHDSVITMDRLHENVSAGSANIIAAMNSRREDRLDSVDGGEAIAVVGMSCVFPKAPGLDQFWQNILDKVNAITEVPKDQWDWERLYDPDPMARDKIYSKWGGFLQDILFDPTLYGIPPSSLASIDPVQLIMLEIARAALIDAGYGERRFPRERTSLVLANAGHGPVTALYSLRSMIEWQLADLDAADKRRLQERLPEWTEDSFPGYLGNVIAGRVCNRFDLGGVNFSIDAACASSLAALYTAVRELRAGASDVVLLGACDTHNQPGDYLSFSKTHALSPRGQCRTFDATADGIVISEGVAMMVLKRLADAERDGDRIYAVVRGIGGSSDGRDLSLTAPSPAGQVLALSRAYRDAGVTPDTVELVEAHGTGTVAGDRAEIEALKQTFGEFGAGKRGCAVGSVKTMIGHAKAAAGLASLIRVSKSLYHKVLPPTIGVEVPNPACDFPNSPFYINSESRPWIHQRTDKSPARRAGVSAFGFGGTNFHAVLEEYVVPGQVTEPVSVSWPSELFLFRGTQAGDLVKAIGEFRKAHDDLLAMNPVEGPPSLWRRTPKLSDLAFAHYLQGLGADRSRHGGLCLAVIADSFKDLGEKLSRACALLADPKTAEIRDPRGIYFAPVPLADNAKIAVLFPGQGSQKVDMLRDLCLFFPEVREAFERADRVLSGRYPVPLSRYVFPPPAFTGDEKALQKRELTNTHVAQAAVGAASLGVWRLLRSFGLEPNMLAGHSYGEYVALCAAGVFDEDGLLHLSERRGLMLSQPRGVTPGLMAAVTAPAGVLEGILQEIPGVTLANINAPSQCIISGSEASVREAMSRLEARQINSSLIAVSAAFHSPLMAGCREELREALQSVDIGAPRKPVFRNTDGGQYQADSDSIVSQLAEHLVQPVRFLDEVEELYNSGARIFVEAGPGSVLTNLVDAILAERPHLSVSVERPGRHGVSQLHHLLGQLASQGAPLDMGRLYRDRYRDLSDWPALRGSTGYGRGDARSSLLYRVNGARVERITARPVQVEKMQSKGKSVGYSNPGLEPETGVPGKAINPGGAGGGRTPVQQLGEGNGKPVGMERNGDGRMTAAGIMSSKSADSRVGLSGKGAPTINQGKVSRNGSEQVMVEFQRSMLEMTNNFLQTQQAVMLAYLSGSGGDPGSEMNKARGQVNPPAFLQSSPPVAEDLVLNVVNSAPAPDANPERSKESSEGSRTTDQSQADGAGAPEMSADALVAGLLGIVSERTGYPPEMLDPNLDLEADLGIDSIKRVEILSNFRRLLPESKQEELEGGVEKLAGTKTLQGIIDWIRADLTGLSSGSSGKENSSEPLSGPSVRAGSHGQISRGLIATVELPPVDNLGRPGAGAIVIVGDQAGVARALQERLEALGQKVILVKHGQDSDDPRCYQSDLSCPDATQKLIERIEQEAGSIVGLIHLVALEGRPSAADRVSGGSLTVTQAAEVKSLFLLLKALAPDWSGQGDDSGRFVVTVTALGGDFASGESRNAAELNDLPFAPMQAGVVGILKSIDREWPSVRCQAVDVSPLAAPEEIAGWVMDEICSGDKPIEVGYFQGKRIGLEVVPAPVDDAAPGLELEQSSVVLVTGGARGITAELASELALTYRPTFVIVGRQSRPVGEESPETAGLVTQRELKAAIIGQLRRENKPVSVPQVESMYQQLCREREMRENLGRLEKAGSKVYYHALDVRDESVFAELIDAVYETHGNIDGVIHGAGVIEDGLVRDKSLDAFDRVFHTKVDGALTLSRNLRLDSLKFLFLFSSVVGRTGNAGQTDYVAANEVVNKLAIWLNQKSRGRVASLMWGPWKGGMAQPELESIFARHGWSMIESDSGRTCFMEELGCGAPSHSEVLLVGKLDQDDAAGEMGSPQRADERAQESSYGRISIVEQFEASTVEPSGTRLFNSVASAESPGVNEFTMLLDPSFDLYLEDHKFDGIPVLPMAFALEMMVEAARTCFPGFEVASVRHLEIPSGIVVDQGSKEIRIRIEEESRFADSIRLQASVNTGNVRSKTHFRALVEMRSSLPDVFKPPASIPEIFKLPELLRPAEALPSPTFLYDNWLFHGPIFQGIKGVTALGADGIAGELVPAGPEECLSRGSGEPWVIDPVLLDSAMQLAGVWARHIMDITVLPTGFRVLHRVSSPSGKRFTGRVFVPPETTGSELLCDLAVYGEDQRLVFLVEGLGGAGSKSFNRFASQPKVLRGAR